ncbi:hypothetical protein BGZ76_010168 [Entomortierella beljakovae]|nr:hypothetical protein BGZ76_010168 [Entomortierella beljakovae]
MVAAKSWKYLNSLEVWGGKVRIDDHNLAKIMRCLPNLRKFCVKGSQVGTFTSSILLSESPTVNYAMNVHMVHKFLTGFPNLTRFRANKIETEEALHEEPWVCTKLKTLSLFFDLGDQSNQWSILNSETWKPSPDIPMDSFRTIYSQLARLTQLDILDTQRHFPTKLLIQREPEYTIHGQRTIGFRLEEGLELLASLTKLRDLRMQQPPHGMRSEDADWIKENWPELEVLDHGGWNFHKSGIYHRHPNGRIIRPGMLRQHEQ